MALPALWRDAAFVQPPCADGHTDDGGECPEWACADCGSAFVIGDAAWWPTSCACGTPPEPLDTLGVRWRDAFRARDF